jgi:hypothetical protein
MENGFRTIKTVDVNEIHVRDPFVFPHADERKYYLFVAIARSAGGSMEGPWTHDEKLFMDRNAGHSSLFRDFDGRLWISTHYPDTPHGQ